MAETIQVVRRRMSFFPRTIIWRDRRHEVASVVASGAHTFDVVLDDGTHADIIHDAAAGGYSLTVREGQTA